MAERTPLSGWGRATRSAVTLRRPSDLEATRRDVLAGTTLTGTERGVIARGLGRSYGDQATNAGGVVIDLTDLSDIPSTVPPHGAITVGGGAGLDDIIQAVVPEGWFVPVSPGTRFVTVGGAIAADVHGKNHHRHGTFGQHVQWLDLLLADGTVTRCSPDAEADLFWATVGGMGLTGVIVAASLQLLPIPSSRLAVDTSRIPDLDTLMSAMVDADRHATYSVAWVDLLARGPSMGRSVLTTADFAPADAVADGDPLAYGPRSLLSAPPWVPNGLLRPVTVRAFNEAWYRKAPAERKGELQSIPRFFHPLDGVRRWNRIYGTGGFVQWQMVVPDGQEDALRRMIDVISASGAPSFLAVLKRFGPQNTAPLSFPMQGWTLAADFPARHHDLASVLDGLDHLVAEAGGRIYLAKDARLRPEMVPIMYPQLETWRRVRAEADPAGRWQSDMSRRLRLC